jgi:hypothetical protein
MYHRNLQKQIIALQIKMTILMEFLRDSIVLCCRFFGLQMEKWKLEAGVTNFTNNSYFTRRATGYLVQESFHLTLEVFIPR